MEQTVPPAAFPGGTAAPRPTFSQEVFAPMDKREKFYLTTPIYYPSDRLHIGHSYCTVAADCLARYKRLAGFDVLFLTGTDEHGQKIEQKARESGVTPKEFVDRVVEGKGGIRDLWKLMNISNDRFIRTTDDYHVEAVQKIFRELHDRGEIYKGAYKGKYCTPCETFWTESQLVDGRCPDCGRPVGDAEEEAYFFRLSKYGDRLLRHYAEHPDFLTPESRRHEMEAFIRQGLQDLCVSRTSFTWGIPVTFDRRHVVYVWVDALFNYMTALGYGNGRYRDLERYWPADVHFVGKEIVRFHAIIWPALLMAMDLPLPKRIYGHGWLLLEGGKMSKSKGNVVDPAVLCGRYGADAVRFFLLRSFPFGSDGVFSNGLLISCINNDLANDLGNLVSRTTAMARRYFDGVLPDGQESGPEDGPLESLAGGLRAVYEREMERFAFQNGLATVFELVTRANKYIDGTRPWILAKDAAKRGRLASVLYHLLECIRIIGILLTPYMPDAAEKMLDRIGALPGERTWESAAGFGALRRTVAVREEDGVLFPRIDPVRELEALAAGQKTKTPPAEPGTGAKPVIGMDAFDAVDLTVCRVLACEPVPKSRKLLRFVLDDGSGKDREILSGIAEYYRPRDLVGKKVLACTNLAPRKMMGLVSDGMLISADHDGRPTLLILDDAIPAGDRLR